MIPGHPAVSGPHPVSSIFKHLPLPKLANRSRCMTTSVSCANSKTPPSNLEGVPIQGLQLGPLDMLQQRLRVANRDFSLIMPADVDTLIDLYCEAGLNDGDPYWTRAWPSSIALASLIISQPELVKGKKVADIGCGLGLASMAAILAGAKEVVMLDREPLALRCALASASATLGRSLSLEPEPLRGYSNQSEGHGSVIAAKAVSHAVTHILTGLNSALGAPSGDLNNTPSKDETFKGLDFRFNGDGVEQFALTGIENNSVNKSQIRARVFDWSHYKLLHEKFDVLLACDVLYEDAAVQTIAELVPWLLSSQPGSRLLLADPPTRTAHNRDRFLSLLKENQGGQRLMVEECSVHQCSVQQLDNEMAGGLSPAQSIPIQLMLLRQVLGSETVGIKSL